VLGWGVIHSSTNCQPFSAAKDVKSLETVIPSHSSSIPSSPPATPELAHLFGLGGACHPPPPDININVSGRVRASSQQAGSLQRMRDLFPADVPTTVPRQWQCDTFSPRRQRHPTTPPSPRGGKTWPPLY